MDMNDGVIMVAWLAILFPVQYNKERIILLDAERGIQVAHH